MLIVKALKIKWLLIIISISQCNAGILDIYNNYRINIEDKNQHILNQTPFIQSAIQYLYHKGYGLTNKLVSVVYHSQYCSYCYDTLFDLEEIFQKDESILPAISDLISVFELSNKCAVINKNIEQLKIKINGLVKPVSNDNPFQSCFACDKCKTCNPSKVCKKCKVCKPAKKDANKMLTLEANTKETKK